MRSSWLSLCLVFACAVLSNALLAPPARSAGWTVGTAGTILKSVDAGASWTLKNPTTNDFHGLYFFDDNTGWAVGTTGSIFRTTDSGTNWSGVFPTSATLNSVVFANSTTGWVVGTGGAILKSTDGGSSWTAQTSSTTATLDGVFFIDANTGWVPGSGGVILKTTNGGTSWTGLTSNTTATLNSVHFVSGTTGWVVGTGGVILKTTNGGTSWTSLNPTTAEFKSVRFVNSTTGWAVGTGGSIFKTTDTGGSWSGTFPTTATLYGVHFVSISVTVNTSPAGRSFTVDGTAYTASQTFTWLAGSSHTIATSSPQAGGAGTQYVWSNWSDGGAISHSVAPTAGTTYTASFTTQYFLTMNAGAGGTVSPASGYRNAASVVSISATPDASHVFSGWTGSGTGSYSGANNPASITMNAPITETGTFTPTVSVTVNTIPSGRSFTVDGTGYSTAQTFTWISGSSHTIATTSPQAGGAGTQYVFTNWSDGGAMSHSVAPISGTTYTATFKTQYLLTMNAGSGGSVSPASGYRDAASAVSIGATPSAGFSFSGWTGSGAGSYSGANNPASITMSAPITETGNFIPNAGVTVDTNPSGLAFGVDGTTYTAPQTFSWTPGSSHTIDTSSPQAGGVGAQYVWSNWSDGGAISHTVAPAASATYTASFNVQFFLTMTAGAGGTVTPASDWHDGGSTVPIQAIPNPGSAYAFGGWSGTGTGSYSGSSNPATVTMDAPISESASFLDLTGVDDRQSAIPTVFFLGPNRPNPAADRTTVAFSLPRGGMTSLRIFDVRGRLVATLAEGDLPAGNYSREWNVRDLSGRPAASGIYYARLQNGADVRARRMVVMR